MIVQNSSASCVLVGARASAYCTLELCLPLITGKLRRRYIYRGFSPRILICRRYKNCSIFLHQGNLRMKSVVVILQLGYEGSRAFINCMYHFRPSMARTPTKLCVRSQLASPMSVPACVNLLYSETRACNAYVSAESSFNSSSSLPVESD